MTSSRPFWPTTADDAPSCATGVARLLADEGVEVISQRVLQRRRYELVVVAVLPLLPSR